MKSPLFALALLAASPAFAQGAQCDRADLQRMADGYLAAQTAGDSIKLPLADFTSYTEQGQDASMSTGMLSHAGPIAAQRTLLDVPTCQAFVALVLTGGDRPAAIGTRLQFSGRDNPIAPSRVNQIESVIVDKAGGAFDGPRAAQAITGGWAMIPPADRDTRATLAAAANAYLDALGDPAAKPPFDPACQAMAAGVAAACAPAGAAGKAAERHLVVDETIGAVAAVDTLGPDKRADMRLLRIEGGRIRAIEVLTAPKAG